MAEGGDQGNERDGARGERSPAEASIRGDAARLHGAEQGGLFDETDFSDLTSTVPANLIDPPG